MIINVKTDPEVLDLLRRAAKMPAATREQIEYQKRSWIIAEIGMGSDADEAAYSMAFARSDRVEMDRLDREAQKRMDLAKAHFEQNSRPS